MRQRNQFQTSFVFKKTLYDIKASSLQFIFNTFGQPPTCHSIKTNCIKLETIDPEIWPILIFQKRAWEQFLPHILHIIFQEKCFSCYIPFTGKILLSDQLYFLRYWAICVLKQLLEINLIFSIKPFIYMTKNSRKK